MLFIIIFALSLFALYLYGTSTFKYWERKGIKHDKPICIFGNSAQVYLLNKSFTQIVNEAYWKYSDERVVGMYRSLQPQLIVRDPEIVKRVLVNDFSHFHARCVIPDEMKAEPLNKNLIFADGDLWKLLRQAMTSAFTVSKLKAMFPLIVQKVERLQSRILSGGADGHVHNAQELMARYLTDVIGACGFGLDTDALDDDDSAIRNLGITIFQTPIKNVIVAICREIFPGSFKTFKLSTRYEKKIIGLVQHILSQRNYEPSERNDFIDLMLECRRRGPIRGNSIENYNVDGSAALTSLEMDESLIAAQVFIFFVAGFESSSIATSHTLLELAYNPEIQKRVQDDVDKILIKYGNKLSYDAVKEMTYLEWTLKESMRMFPPIGWTKRRCMGKQLIPELNTLIDVGVDVIIPIHALQNDPKYFEKPNEFHPERFSPENIHKINKFTYLPFGDGPRACIGARLATMQSVAGLAAILSRFSVEPTSKTQRHPDVDPMGDFVQNFKHGPRLVFRERKFLKKKRL